MSTLEEVDIDGIPEMLLSMEGFDVEKAGVLKGLDSEGPSEGLLDCKGLGGIGPPASRSLTEGVEGLPSGAGICWGVGVPWALGLLLGVAIVWEILVLPGEEAGLLGRSEAGAGLPGRFEDVKGGLPGRSEAVIGGLLEAVTGGLLVGGLPGRSRAVIGVLLEAATGAVRGGGSVPAWGG